MARRSRPASKNFLVFKLREGRLDKMQKRGIITLAAVFVLGVGGYAIAQQMRPGPYMGSQMMVESAGGRAAQAVPSSWS